MPDKCPLCGGGELHHAYMLYRVFKGVYCWNCGEFIALWGGVAANFLMEWFVAPFVDHFPICVEDQRWEKERKG